MFIGFPGPYSINTRRSKNYLVHDKVLTMRGFQTLRFLSLLIVFLTFTEYPCFSQSAGSVSGTVLVSGTGEPLPGVEIVLSGTLIGTLTESNGTFFLGGVPPGDYFAEARFMGFKTQERAVTIEVGKKVILMFSLHPVILEVPEIVIEQASMFGGIAGINGIPGSAHRLSPRMLSKFQHTDINRILREVPGITLIEEDGYGLRPNIGIRGTGAERSSKISLMEDGVLIAPAPYAAPAAYYFPTISRMSEVEVRKGFSQIKYGPYTTGGALNLITTPIPNRLSGMVRALGGKDDDRTLYASFGSSYSNFGFLIETHHATTDGFKRLDYGGNTGFEKNDYLAKLALTTDENASVYQAAELKISRTTEVSNETYLGLTESDFAQNPLRRYAGSSNDQMRSAHEQVVLRHLIRPAQRVQIATTVYRTAFARNWYKLNDVIAAGTPDAVGIAELLANPEDYPHEYRIITGSENEPEDLLHLKANNRDYLSRGVQSELDLSYGAFGYEQKLEIGVRIHADEMDRFQWVDTYSIEKGIMHLTEAGSPGTDSNRIESANALAGYVQNRFDFGRFVVLPGVRYEHIKLKRKDYGKNDPGRIGDARTLRENTVDVLIPGIGFSYSASTELTLFGGVHKGFSPPGSKEGTRPEKSTNFEMGARFHTDLFSVDATIFFHDYSNLLGSDLAASGGSGTTDQFNGGEVDVSGIEISTAYNLGYLTGWKLSIPVRLAMTGTSAIFRSDFESAFEPWGTVQSGARLPYVPRYQMNAGIGLEGKHFDVELSASYTDVMLTVASSSAGASHEQTDAHLVLDVSAGITIFAHTRLFATVRNLTNSVYVVARRPAGLRPGLPRTTLVGITKTF